MQYQRDKNNLKVVGAKIKALRISKGYSQAKLAADCNVEISQISRLERGLLNTGLTQIFLIADALEVEVKEIFE